MGCDADVSGDEGLLMAIKNLLRCLGIAQVTEGFVNITDTTR